MTIDEAFKYLLLNNWSDQDQEYKDKFKIYKTRYLNLSGKNEKNVSQDKMREMLLLVGYKEKWTKPAKKKKPVKKVAKKATKKSK